MASFRPIALALSCALCGCTPIPPQPSASVCPPIETYSNAEQDRLAAELDALAKGDVLRKVANEDHRLRAALKACRAP